MITCVCVAESLARWITRLGVRMVREKSSRVESRSTRRASRVSRVYRLPAVAAFAFFSISSVFFTPAKSMYLPLQYASVLYHLCPNFPP